MLTGRAAFEGEDPPDILSRVLQRDPVWTLLPASVPPRVRELLTLCLQKDARKRRSDAADVRIDIEQALADPHGMLGSETPVVSRNRVWKRAVSVLTPLILGALVAGIALWTFRPTSPPAIVTRFAFPSARANNSSVREAIWSRYRRTERRSSTLRIDDCTSGAWVSLKRRRFREARVRSPFGIRYFHPIAVRSHSFRVTIRCSSELPLTGGATIPLCPARLPYGMSWNEDGILFGQ